MKKNITIISVIVIIAVISIIVVTSTLSVRKTVEYNGTVIGSVGEETVITRSRNGVPGIKARSLGDAYLALGFLHAQDRMVLMEYYRAIASGKLSSLTGEECLAIDRVALLCGFRQDAGRIYGLLDDTYKKYLTKYTEGVNLFRKKEMQDIIDMAQLPSDKWVPEDVLAILFLLDWAHSFHNNREQVYLIHEDKKSRILSSLMPGDLTYYYNDLNRNNVLFLKELKTTVGKYLGTFCEGFSFFIPSRFTGEDSYFSGATYDSAASRYPLWYPVTVDVDSSRISALTAAGLPFLLSGSKKEFSYAVFNKGVDVQDYYIEKTKNEKNDTVYLNRGRWKKIKKVMVNIKIGSGGNEATGVPCTLRFKEGFPVVSDIFSDRFHSDTITMVFPRPGKNYIQSLFDIPLSKTVAEVKSNVARQDSVPKAYLISSQDSAVLAYAGNVPYRNISKRIFQKGTSFGRGNRYLPLNRYSKKSGRDILIASSSPVYNEPGPVRSYEFSNNVMRLQRLSEILSENSAWELRHIKLLFHDTLSAIAEKFAPLFHGMLGNVSVTSGNLTRIYFKNWDYQMETDSVPASIFHVLMEKMITETLKDELRDDAYALLDEHDHLMENLYRVFADDSSQLFNNISTGKNFESRGDVFQKAFMKTLYHLNSINGPKMEDWHWGNIHSAAFDLPLGRKESYLRENFLKTERKGFPGDGSSISLGTVQYNNNFRCGKVSAVSVLYTQTGEYVSQAFGISMNPFSDFNASSVNQREFYNFCDDSPKHIMRIVPDRTGK